MSERYNVAASAVLGDNYKITNIVCSDYNPNIDSTITVTVSVDDVYGDAVSGESVTVTASEGTFTQLNGSDITASDSVTGTTNSSGQFTLTYSCTEWGLITFSANNKNIQVRVTGWRTVATYLYYLLEENDGHVRLKIHINTNITFNTSWTTIYANFIPLDYAPLYPVTVIVYASLSATDSLAIGVRETNDSKVEIMGKSLTGSSVSSQAYCVLEWTKK